MKSIVLSRIVLRATICFSLTLPASAQNYKILNDATRISTPFIQGTDGNLWGVNSSCEFVKASLTGAVRTVAPLPGCSNVAPLFQATDGNFYGTTTNVDSYSTIFRLTPSGVFTTLYQFASDEKTSGTAMIQATDGDLYVTAASTIYKLSLSGQVTAFYTFPISSGNIASPLLQATDGNFYGTTNGTVFRLTPNGGLTTLFTFTSANQRTAGIIPAGNIVQALRGSLYGVTSDGGANNLGTLFEITTSGVFNTIHSFSFEDGYVRGAPQLFQATNGSIYGTLGAGGTTLCDGGVGEGCGTIFELTPAGVYSVVHSFIAPNGAFPFGLLEDTNGTLYGITAHGGPGNDGVIFSLGLGLGQFVNPQPPAR